MTSKENNSSSVREHILVQYENTFWYSMRIYSEMWGHFLTRSDARRTVLRQYNLALAVSEDPNAIYITAETIAPDQGIQPMTQWYLRCSMPARRC
jgi:hypothetical protein